MSTSFQSSLASYQRQLQRAVEEVAERMLTDTRQHFGDHAALATEAYARLLTRGGKRLRGALVLHGYALRAGQNKTLALQAAVAVEMLHAYILIIDDIQDRSALRRGDYSVHMAIEQIAQERGWRGDQMHTGVSLALNAALIGGHQAQLCLTELPCSEAVRLQVIALINETMITTAHGQTGDIINEVNGQVTTDEINQVIARKTAYYSLHSPLQLGLLLGGADEAEQAAVADYALATGRAFQITDDLFTYRASTESGKDITSDVREGKMTLPVQYALDHASKDDAARMRAILGKQSLTDTEFQDFVAMVKQTGAIADAEAQAQAAYDEACTACSQFPESWSSDGVDFLRDLARYVIERRA